MAEYKVILVSELGEPPAPVRASIDEGKIVELADSIKQIGIIQPLIVTPSDTGYEVVAGHRRLLASRHLGLESVPCIVYADSELAKQAVMLHENIYREDLTAAEEGIFYAELIDQHDLTEEALCTMVKQKPQYIYDRLALVQGDAEVLKAVAERRINFSVAKELNKCANETMRRSYLDTCERGGASAATVRQWVSKTPTVELPQEAQTEAAVLSADNPFTAAPAMCCFLCGKSDAPQNLRSIYLCFYEVDSIIKILAANGIEVHGAASGV